VPPHPPHPRAHICPMRSVYCGPSTVETVTIYSPISYDSPNTFARAISILSSTRPSLLSRHATYPPSIPSLKLESSPSPFTQQQPPLDLLPRISNHPSLATIQVRNGPRDTYNPSHRVRKRRHGFLSRVKTRKGTATLKRRRLKGRATLSH